MSSTINRKYLLLIFSIGFSVMGWAQTGTQALRGIVTNANNDPLAYATVGIKSNGITTITNINGAFSLQITTTQQVDSISISMTGYITKAVSVDAFKKTTAPLVITMQQMIVELSEVIIKPVNAKELIQKAIDRIPMNTFSRPAVTKGFFRELAERDDRPMLLSEALFDIYHYDASVGIKDQLKLIQKRSIHDEQATAGLEFAVSPESIRDFDIVEHIRGNGILNTNDFDKYDFKYKGESTYDGSPAFVITFDQKKNRKESLYAGIIYLDKETYAFIAFNFARSAAGLKYAKYGNGKMRLLLKMMGISITIKEDAYQISYRRFGDQWVFSSAKTKNILVFKSDRKQYDFTCRLTGDYLNTEIDTLRTKPFEADEVLSTNKSIAFKPDEPELSFWKDYNIILPDYDEKKIIALINTSNSHTALKQTIEKNLSKYSKDRALRIDSILSFYHQYGNFNGSVLIKNGEKILLQKNYGLANRERNIPLTGESAFRIGSLSKSFTALLVQQLNAEGKLQLEDSVGRFFPSYIHKQVTIEQLLTHTSGIPNFTTADRYVAEAMIKRLSPEMLMFKYCSDSLDFKPGSSFRYSNSGYTILAAIIEKLRDLPLNEVLQQYIFHPLAMNHTGFASDTLNTTGYVYNSPEPVYPIANMAGGGGISSTISDLLKWEQAMNDSLILRPALLAQMFQPKEEYRDWGAYYGYGWMIDRSMFSQSKKHRIVYHPGTDFGYYSMFVMQPDKRTLIVLLNNTGDFERFDITELLLNELNK